MKRLHGKAFRLICKIPEGGEGLGQVEIILRTRESSGETKEQILAVLRPEQVQQILREKEQEFSRLCIDPMGHKVSYEGKKLPLSELEYQLLFYLSGQPGRIFTKEQLFKAIWKEEPVDTDNAVCCTISSIRRKLRMFTKKEYIQTVWGAGYKFVDIPGE